MDNVIDFFSRSSYKDITSKHYQRNDEFTEKYGIYIGCLKEEDTKAIRNISAALEFKHQQIEQLNAEWANLYGQYCELLQHCLDYLKLPRDCTINLEKDTVMISVEGNSWVIHNYKEAEEKYGERL